MISAENEVLARLRLVQGRSDTELREFVRSRGQTQMLTVGSDRECDWYIGDAGIAPIQFSLHWDGANLRIADTHGAGNVRVEGTMLTSEWRRLSGRMRVDFGRASMLAETLGGSPAVMVEGTVQVAPSVRVAGSDSSPPGARARAGEDRYAGRFGEASVSDRHHVEERHTQPEVQLVASPPANSLVLHRDAQGIVDPPPARAIPRSDSSARIPKGVLVLSPILSDSVPPPASSTRVQPRLTRREEHLSSWRNFALGWLAVIGGYACWLYLLYTL